jgi:hypothetical protein
MFRISAFGVSGKSTLTPLHYSFVRSSTVKNVFPCIPPLLPQVCIIKDCINIYIIFAFSSDLQVLPRRFGEQQIRMVLGVSKRGSRLQIQTRAAAWIHAQKGNKTSFKGLWSQSYET